MRTVHHAIPGRQRDALRDGSPMSELPRAPTRGEAFRYWLRLGFSEAELDRYARHILLREIGGPGQKALKAAKIPFSPDLVVNLDLLTMGGGADAVRGVEHARPGGAPRRARGRDRASPSAPILTRWSWVRPVSPSARTGR